MTSRRALHIGVALCALVAGGPLALAARAAQDDRSEKRFTAFAVNLGTPGPAWAETVEIVINRWSTDAERDRLFSTLMERGPDDLLDELVDMPRVGYIRTPTSLAYDLHFARRARHGDGERILLMTDRPISFWEAVNRPRVSDYPFTLIELRLDGDGKGEGKLSVAARITGDKASRLIEIENYASQPAMLKDVRRKGE